ncbi:MAG TPA: glycosyltransferase family 2 protein [Candidatus Binatia bacterium]|nr:glycosyltransferase family 2 protein [Candidatus Binatia bacterium]
MSGAVTPRVSVGMPVRNLETTVARAIESVLAQTFTAFELIVSDNGSTDGTEAICRRYAAGDARIRYARQTPAIGGVDNYRWVLEAARAPYFMWLAADDFILPGLLAQAVGVLDARPDVVTCTPGVEFLEPDGRRRRAPGTFALMGTLDDNLRRFLYDPMDNSRFYGLGRRDVLRRVMPARGDHAFDWIVSVGMLMAGRHWELDEVLLVREANAPDKYSRMVDAAFSSAPARLLPLLPFTRALLFDLRVPRSPGILWALARLNVVYHVLYSLYRYPRYGRLAQRVGAALERGAGAAWRAVRGKRPRLT